MAPLGTLKAIFLFAVGFCGGCLVTLAVTMFASLYHAYGDFSASGMALVSLAPAALGTHQIWLWASKDRRVWCYWIGWLVGCAGVGAFFVIVLPAFG